MYRGDVVPVRDIVVQDGRKLGLWFDDAPHVRNRSLPIRWQVWHWQAGEGRAAAVFRVLRARRLSCHFQVDQDGMISQFADLSVVTMHAGHANEESVSIETSNRGLAPAMRKWPRESYEAVIHDRSVEALRYYPAQLEACRRLACALEHVLRIPRELPRDRDGQLIRRKLHDGELARHRGVLGHYHVHASKACPGPELLEAVGTAGPSMCGP